MSLPPPSSPPTGTLADLMTCIFGDSCAWGGVIVWLSVDFVDSSCEVCVSCEFNLGVTVDSWAWGGIIAETCVGDFWFGFSACADSLGGGSYMGLPPPSSPPTGTMADRMTC